MNLEEFDTFLKKTLPSETSLQKHSSLIFNLFDRNDSQTIELEEFIILLVIIDKNTSDSEKIKLVFKFFDQDENGFLSPEEIKRGLKVLNELKGKNETMDELEETVKKIFSQFDLNKDNKIKFDELFMMFRSSSHLLGFEILEENLEKIKNNVQ
jgi:Ca2+-binding EF-hand superfamily protein